jgi:RND family efflux transporter MFP subunit
MQKRSMGRRILRWAALALGVVLILAAGVFLAQSGWIDPLLGAGSAARTGAVTEANGSRGTQVGTVTTVDGAEVMTVALRPAASGVGVVSAAGNLALAQEQRVVIEVTGIVSDVLVNVGDTVAVGDLLAVLDSRSAEEAVEQALLDFASAQAAYDDELAGADASEIAAAEANLRAAQANLADVQDGASPQELAGAQASLAAAQAEYAELLAGPSDAELSQLSADLRKAEVAVAEAQTEYDAIAWRNDAGMTSQAAALQSATIDLERAQGAFLESTADPNQSQIQTALSQIQNAQQSLTDLRNQPTAAQIADAESQVASAESNLQTLVGNSVALETARVQLAQAQLNLNSAVADLAHTELRAPVSGAVLAVNLVRGQQVGSGAEAITLADTSDLELTVNVAEVDIDQITVGMPASIALDALPGQSFDGVVERVAPASDPNQSVVNYPVTIQLTDPNLGKVRSGMTAVATLTNQDAVDGLLAPRSAVQETDGRPTVTVVRDGQAFVTPVTTGEIQGEWIVVQADDLQAGDEIVGEVASFVDENSGFPFGPGGGAPRPPGAPRNR